MNVVRPYLMTNRAAAAALTADRILDAAKELFTEKGIADITLADIAARSGVTVQTILRRFGDKDSVFAAAIARFGEQVRAERDHAVPNDLDDIVANLVQHYEQWGHLMIKMLGEEATSPALRDTVAAAKAYHRAWCEAVFPDALSDLPKVVRPRRLAQLVAICDLRTWEQLRIDAGLSRQQTKTALFEMLARTATKEQ
ncbi:MAG: TetR/AcrR family transcriptional regulator [Mycobacterium sp.]